MGDDTRHSGEHDPWRDLCMRELQTIARDVREGFAEFRAQFTAGAADMAAMKQRIALLEAANIVRDRAEADAKAARESARNWNLGIMSVIAVGAVGARELIAFLVALGHAAAAAPHP
jgi:hypothetical protein